MTPKNHCACVVRLIQVLFRLQDTVDPTRYRDTLLVHHRTRLSVFIQRSEATFQPIEILFPYTRPVSPRARCQTVVARQCICQNTQVGCALYVTVATEDVGTTTCNTHVTQRQLEHTVCTCVVVTVGVLSTTHTPDNCTWTVVRQSASNTLELRTRSAGYTLNLCRVPALNLFTDVIHAVDTSTDELFIFPVILEDVPENTPDQRNVCAGTETHVLVSMGCGTGESWVTYDHRCVVLFFRFEDMQQRHRMRFGWVTPDQEDRFRLVNIVVGVGHRTVTPGIRYTCHRS